MLEGQAYLNVLTVENGCVDILLRADIGGLFLSLAIHATTAATFPWQ